MKPARWLCQSWVLKKSGYFDSDWYRTNNPDLRTAQADPLRHYLNYGAHEGRNPSDKFNTEYYFAEHPDVLATGINPVVHFELWGKDEGNSPAPAQWRGEANGIPADRDEIRRIRQTALGAGLPLQPANIAIGIVGYNNTAFQMRRLLRSIDIGREHLPGHIQVSIFLIDNGEPADLPPDGPAVSRIPSRGNIGFAAAQNILMHEAFAASATHFIAANPDGCFHPDCLEALIRMCQAGGNRALVEALQFPDEHPKAYDPYTFDTPWAAGTCLLMSRSVYDAIGGFDPSFFMYCEDVDLSWRARIAGIAVKICPRALYMHHIQYREYDLARHRRFLVSGLVLARKWGNSIFADRMLTEMKKFNFAADGVPSPKRLEDTLGVTDFGHFFSFAPTRWT